jgi:hypothetical protein
MAIRSGEQPSSSVTNPKLWSGGDGKVRRGKYDEILSENGDPYITEIATARR